jgi:hypothetical protein
MLRSRTVAAIVAGGLVVAACGTDGSTMAPETESGPAFRTQRTENSPSGPGAMVFRSRGGFFTTWPSENYLVEIGLSARGVAAFCRGGDLEEGMALTQFVERPHGGIQELFKSEGKVPLLLFPADAEDICSAEPVAEGSGIYTENAANFLGGRGLPRFGFRIRGHVTDEAGDRHHVVVIVQTQLRSDGFHRVVEKVSVN